MGTFLAFVIPLPDPPDTPEKLHFIEHRAEYEIVIELVQNNELEQTSSYCLHPPENLNHVSNAGCMYVEKDEYRGRGLSVRFNPIENFYHPVVYVEFDNVDNPCGYDSYVEQRIDDHWYVCEIEWN